MPVEVRELVIKAMVDSEKKPASKSEDVKATKKNVSNGLERLLRMIKNKNER